MRRFTDPDTGTTYLIEDASKAFKVKVTSQNIREAKQCDACHCAIAQGAKDNPKVEYVRIGAGVAFVGFVGNIHKESGLPILNRFVLKNTDRWFAKAFDIARAFQAGTYTLLPPTGSRKLGHRVGSKPGTNVRNGRAKTVYNSPQLRGVFWPSQDD